MVPAIIICVFGENAKAHDVTKEEIAAVCGGELYEILAAEPYISDDLNNNDSSRRSTKEQNDKNVRPEIGSEDISLEGYSTRYITVICGGRFMADAWKNAGTMEKLQLYSCMGLNG